MADSLLVGDNIAVWATNDENDKFWIMLVCKGAHRVEDAFVDDAGNEYIPGNMVISKYWYERYSRPRSHSYFLRDNWAIVYVYTHIVVVPKFSMLPILGGLKWRFASYELTTPVMEIILDAIGQCEALDWLFTLLVFLLVFSTIMAI
jgi:hypothetical protein